MAARLGIRAIAEGVESEGQARLLEAAENCDSLQGYLFARRSGGSSPSSKR